MQEKITKLTNLFFEVGFLNQILRSQRKSSVISVAEHTYRVSIIGFVIARAMKANVLKTLTLCLFHDLPETRIDDMDFINKKYVTGILENQAMADIVKNIKELQDIPDIMSEFNHGKSLEAKIARDADLLEDLLSEKEKYDHGDNRAKYWLKFSFKNRKLETKMAQLLANSIAEIHSDTWWNQIVEKK